jgi:hypothetical protein
LIDFAASGVVDAPAAAVFAVVSDLGTYPSWLGIVLGAAPDGDAWLVDIGARLGPLRRTKRLRMARTVCDAESGRVEFTRAELDPRPHAPWRLSTGISTGGGAVEIGVGLHYGGSLAVPGLERLLAREAKRAIARLERLARDRAE